MVCIEVKAPDGSREYINTAYIVRFHQHKFDWHVEVDMDDADYVAGRFDKGVFKPVSSPQLAMIRMEGRR